MFCGVCVSQGGWASNKVGTTRFQWVNGLAEAAHLGCEDSLNATKINPLTVAWSHRDQILIEHDHILRADAAASDAGSSL
jgi:hypothetical protein